MIPTRWRSALAVAIAVFTLGAALLAHSVTGTVVSAEPTAITIKAVDETTKKSASMTFDINKDTKIQRGTKTVTFAEARIQKGEKVSITVEHDVDMNLAVLVKLDARK